MKEMNIKDSDNMQESYIKSYIKYYAVYGTKDLERKFRNSLHAPPSDMRCMCCGRHISELQPFGKTGDPLFEDINGALLLKSLRRDVPYNEKAENAVEEAGKHYADDGYKNALEWMEKKYGKEEAKEFYFWSEAYDIISDSWECR
jgi:hypothetical protein